MKTVPVLLINLDDTGYFAGNGVRHFHRVPCAGEWYREPTNDADTPVWEVVQVWWTPENPDWVAELFVLPRCACGDHSWHIERPRWAVPTLISEYEHAIELLRQGSAS